MTSTAYTNLALIIDELRKLAENGEWAAAAQVVSQLNQARLPDATQEDRKALETIVSTIADIEERAEYLHGDLSRLLKAFDKSGQSADTRVK